MDFDGALQLTQQLYKALDNRREDIQELDDYYEGKQPLAFASREWADFHKDRYIGFSDNWCGSVANAPAERQHLIGIQLSSGKKQSPKVRQIWDDWHRNDGDMQSSQGFLETTVAKRSFVIVWGNDDNEPEFTWEHPSQVIIKYAADNPRRKVAALKAWVDEKTEYATLYTADELWKFKRTAGVNVTNGVTDSGLTVVGMSALSLGGNQGWEAYQPPEDDVWPLPNPLGRVPVVEYPNRPRLDNDPMSDIAGTKAMQDAVNLLWAYLFTSADHASFPARVVMGQDPPKVPVLDENGNKIGEKQVDIKELQHGRMLWLTGQGTSISQWDSAKLDVFTQVIEIAVGHIAAQTRTPPHYLVANKGISNLSGDALVAAETGLVKKVLEQQLYFSSAVRDQFRLMALVRDDKKLADGMRTSTPQWANAAMRSEAQLTDALQKKRDIGYPFEYLLELDGLSPTEVSRVLEMARREQLDPYLSNMAEKDATNVDTEPSVDSA